MKRFFVVIFISIHFNVAFSQSVDKDLLKKHVFTLADDSLMGRGFGTRGGRMAADYIEKQFIEAGIQPWNGVYKYEFIHSGMMLKTEGCNIVGWVEGSDPELKNEYIVIGAHYDHLAYVIKGDKKVVYNGADDNASGTAALIELGRWLASNSHQLKRSVILVAFDGEESGLIGSSYLVKKNQIPVDKVKMMFSMDMVGMFKQYGGLDLVGNTTLKGGEEIFNPIAQNHGINIRKQGNRAERQTDTAPFGLKAIPVVHVFTSTVSPYHQPGDDAHLLDYDGMVTITNFMADVVVNLSNQQVLKPNSLYVARTTGKWYIPVFGLRLGAGNSNHVYPNEFYDGKQIFAAQAGLFMQVKLGQRFSLQPEVLYRTAGSEHASGVMRTHEVVTPVNLRLNLISHAENMTTPDLFVLLGPYYSYKFYGKSGGNELDYKNQFYKDEKGIQYGIGIEMAGFQMVSTVQHSLTSIERGAKVMPRAYTFSFGYVF
jgi:hypothetical protein